MKKIELNPVPEPVNFELIRDLADKAVKNLAHEIPMLLSWNDRHRDIHSPASVLCEIQGMAGWEAYAINRGARYRVSVNDGAYVFLYA